MVNGLVYSVVISATGKLTLSKTASSTAEIICNGPGIRPQNNPIAAPPATERRCRCHRFGCCKRLPNGLSQRWFFTVSWCGRNSVSYTHLRAHETDSYLVCRLLLEK